jgi:RHS repeat-associated protein
MAETYNALGWRVEASGDGTLVDYLHDAAGKMMGGVYTGGSNQFMYFRGGLLAQYVSGDGARFAHLNALGSAQQFTDWTGGNPMDTIFYPWGQPAVAGSGVEALWAGFDDGNGWLLHEWQTVTRRYSQGVSRWFTPDRIPGNPTNPQSWNMYAYVLNNPTSLIDPVGLHACPSGLPPGVCDAEHGAQSNQCEGDDGMPNAGCGGNGYQTARFGPPPTGDWDSGLDSDSGLDLGASDVDCPLCWIAVPPPPSPLETPPDLWVWLYPEAADLTIWQPTSPGGTMIGPQKPHPNPGTSDQWNKVNQFFCGKSPADIILQDAEIGATYGAAYGAVTGGVAGEAMEPVAGGFPGAAFGAYFMAHLGFIDGTIKGTIAAGACSAFGVY